jgi:hypothetical protein
MNSIDDTIEKEAKRSAQQEMNNPMASLFGEGGLGGSPVSELEQARLEIISWIQSHLADPETALIITFIQYIRQEEDLLTQNLQKPLVALKNILLRIVENQSEIIELTRKVDSEWGRLFQERPYFQVEGKAAHPLDPYTYESIEKTLRGLVELL